MQLIFAEGAFVHFQLLCEMHKLQKIVVGNLRGGQE